MAYVTQTDIEVEIPAPHLVDALDDDRDGVPDSNKVDEVIARASSAVDAFLGGIYSVPFADPAPAPVKEAALIFAGEAICQRRQLFGDANPYNARANAWRLRLADIGKGKEPLAAGLARNFAPGAAVTEAAAVDGSTR